jgi:hypothetical protein
MNLPKEDFHYASRLYKFKLKTLKRKKAREMKLY